MRSILVLFAFGGEGVLNKLEVVEGGFYYGNSILAFNGDCGEVFNLYAKALGGGKTDFAR